MTFLQQIGSAADEPAVSSRLQSLALQSQPEAAEQKRDAGLLALQPDHEDRVGLLFGMCEALRLAGLKPYRVLLDRPRAGTREGGRAPESLDRYLPRRMRAQRRNALSRAGACAAEAVRALPEAA